MARSASARRYFRILERQAEPERWGKDYQPALQTGPGELPRTSRPRTIAMEKLGKRRMVLHSGAEYSIALLALYHPNVWEIHEQRALWPVPRPHPLAGHPLGLGLNLPPFKGTLDVAERLGCLNRHPRVNVAMAGMPAHWAPQFLVGDLLLFLIDAAGPYCVNLTVKAAADAFVTNPFSQKPRGKTKAPDEKVIFRQEIEAVYYQDAGIRTVQVTPEIVDIELIRNLERISLWATRDFYGHVPDGVEGKVLDFARQHVGSDLSLYGIAQAAASRFGIDVYDAKIIIRRGIWSRQVRIDLFSRVLDDQPVRPEKRDPAVVYRHLFAREGA